jgi:flagellar motility protein MotE (MotC chaperone)
VPLAGNLLFGDKVWPILWNKSSTPAKPATQAPAPASQSNAPSATTQPSPSQTAAQSLLDQAQARLAAAEAKENELKQRETALKTQEAQLKAQTDKLAQTQADVEGLKVQLQGQLRTEQDRVEIVRSMRSSAQVQFFGALTDDEAVAVLKYMTADEISKILAGMDPYRSARLFYRLPTVAQPPTTP